MITWFLNTERLVFSSRLDFMREYPYCEEQNMRLGGYRFRFLQYGALGNIQRKHLEKESEQEKNLMHIIFNI